jgi:parallel beta-helix repeat protein
VRWYGAVGDGSTSDSTAINKAIAAGSAAELPVVIPASTTPYMVTVTDPILVLDNTELVIRPGATLRAIGSSETNYTVISVLDVSNVLIHGGGTVAGERDTHIGSTGEWGHVIGIYGSDNVTVRDLNITDGWGDGIYIGYGSADTNTNVRVLNNHIYGNRRNNISTISVTNAVIDANIVVGESGGTAPSEGINLEPNAGNTVSNVSVTNNIVSGNTGNGIGLTRASTATIEKIAVTSNQVSGNGAGIGVSRSEYVTVTGNTVVGNTEYGIKVAASGSSLPATNVSISANTCSGNGTSGIEVNGNIASGDIITDISISGNTTTGNTYHGIYVHGVAGNITDSVSIIGNTTSGNTLCGVKIDSAEYIVVSSNSITDNTTNGVEVTGAANTAEGNMIVGNAIRNNTENGVKVTSSPFTVVNNNTIFDNGMNGLLVTTATDITVNSNSFLRNGQTADDTYSHISFASGSDRASIVGNKFRHGGGSYQTKYALNLSATTDNCLCTGNDFTLSAKTTEVVDGGTSNKIHANIGWVTENSGTSSAIATGGTIAHGLDITPTSISLLPVTAGPSGIYATADGTNITVNYTGGGTEAFYWTAQ